MIHTHLRRIVSAALASLLLCPAFLSCHAAGTADAVTDDNRTVITAPAPAEALEENAVLRRPDAVANPDDYAIEPLPPAAETDGEIPSDTAAVTPPPTQSSEVPGETRLSFVAVGDNILHSAIIEDAKNHAKDGAEYDFTYIYDNVRDEIAAADIAFVNQETPMGGKALGYYGYPNFNGPQEAGDALVDCGFDIVCIATNHMADHGDAGLRGSIDYWNSQPVTLIGGYKNKADYDTIRVHEKDGVKIALLAYTFLNVGTSLSAGSELVIPYTEEAEIRRQVAMAKEVGDLVIVNMHWGLEQFQVTAEQKKYAQLLCDLGVDVVIGEHPHVLQPMEWMENEDGHKTLLTYSLGNFLSTMYNDFYMVGGMLSFDIVKTEKDTTIENPQLIPTVTFYDVNRANLSIYFLDAFTEELASSHGTNAHGATSLEQLRGYVTQNIPKEFLPENYK